MRRLRKDVQDAQNALEERAEEMYGLQEQLEAANEHVTELEDEKSRLQDQLRAAGAEGGGGDGRIKVRGYMMCF